jgi:hypothetical protein
LDELSFETAGDLLANQPDKVLLATIGLTAAATGIGAVDFSFAALSDEAGFELTLEGATGAIITVTTTPPPPVSTPDASSTGFLLSLAGIAIFGLRRHPRTAYDTRPDPSRNAKMG